MTLDFVSFFSLEFIFSCGFDKTVNLLARTIQGTYISEGGGFDYDQSWLCTMCALPSLQKRHVAIARLKHPANMGRNSHEVRFFIMVLTPSKEVRIYFVNIFTQKYIHFSGQLSYLFLHKS